MSEGAFGVEGVTVGFKPVLMDVANWKTYWLCEKWSEDACDFVRHKLALRTAIPISSELLRKHVGKPEAETEAVGNLLLNEGIQEMEDLLIAFAGSIAFTNAVADMGVGDSNAAEAATQTDLQAATNKLFKAMNATYPSRATQTLTFQSDFLTAEANWAWQEMSIRNGVTRNRNLNRKVASLGTKTTGTWTLTGTVAIS
jgi:hypothetical protein